MSAKKLGRFAGLVLALAAILGGVAVQGAGSSSAPTEHAAHFLIDWY